MMPVVSCDDGTEICFGVLQHCPQGCVCVTASHTLQVTSLDRFVLQELELQLSEQRGLTQAIALQAGGARLCNPPPEEHSQASPW